MGSRGCHVGVAAKFSPWERPFGFNREQNDFLTTVGNLGNKEMDGQENSFVGKGVNESFQVMCDEHQGDWEKSEEGTPVATKKKSVK